MFHSRNISKYSSALLFVAILYCLPTAYSHTDSTAAPDFIAARTFSLEDPGNITGFAGNPRSMTLGDFNSDGKPDIAVANDSSPTVSVVLANGDGTFGPATRFTVGSFPRFVIARDVNKDAILDLAVANSNSASVSILLGNGSGSFGSATNFSVGSSPSSLTIADFNNDGNLDLVSANFASNNVSLLLGNGAGAFSGAVGFAVGNPSSIASGDFNGDSRPDLAMVSFNAPSVQVMLNNGAGSFLAPVPMAVGANPLCVLVSDLNNDGKLDLVTANSGSNTASVLLGNGTGSFASAVHFATNVRPFSVVSADLNGDGKLDLAVANSLSHDFSVLLGDGSGSFGSATNFVAGPMPQSLASGDFNLDGHADIAQVHSNSNNVWIFTNKGNGTFVTAPNFPSGTQPSDLVVSDFNSDGKADVATTNRISNDVAVLLGTGSGTLAAATFFPVGTNPQSLAAADFNADNKIDLLVGKISPNELCLLLGNGAGGFGAPVPFAVPGLPLTVATGDFNGDGKVDAVAAANGIGINAPSVAVLLGDGAGGFSAPVLLSTSEAALHLAVGDFNADGKSDMAVAGGSRLAIFLGSATGQFGPPILYQMLGNDGTPNHISNLLAVDLNGDGKIDLALSIALHFTTLFGIGDGNFGPQTNSDPTGTIGTAGDFNGDGKIDLAFGLGVVSVLTNTGAGVFGLRKDYAAGTAPVSIASGDFNGDGKLDLVNADPNLDIIFVLLNAGNSPGLQLSSANYAAGEGDGVVVVTVTRSGNTSGEAAVEYTTSDNAQASNCNVFAGHASSRCDYEITGGVLRFAPGETSRTISIPIIDDAYAEGSETFTITLSNASGATLDSPSTAGIAISDNDNVTGPNPIDDASFFVRQHYLDFLNRRPDASGLAFWTNQITSCGSDQSCVEVRRINVSAAFFLSIEFQETGFLVYRANKAAYGNIPGTPVPVHLPEFMADTRLVGQGVVVGESGWEQLLASNKQAFVTEFVLRSRFTTAYPTSLTPAQFVDTLYAHAEVTPAASERAAVIGEFGSAINTADAAARARVLQRVAENSVLASQETNKAFVLMQYFGYLRREPSDAPEPGLNYDGYNFWLNKLNQFNGNFVNAEMVKAFITSGEYRQRFGP